MCECAWVYMSSSVCRGGGGSNQYILEPFHESVLNLCVFRGYENLQLY